MSTDVLTVEVPDRIGYVVGLRFWTRTNLWGPVLQSPFRHTVWRPRQAFYAKCEWEGRRCIGSDWSLNRDAPVVEEGVRRDAGIHGAAPAEGCYCGVYAVTDWTEVIDYDIRHACASCAGRAGVPVFGAVALWGPVISGTHGWRGRYAYPVALFAPPPHMTPERYDEPWVARVAEAYGVPYLPWKSPEVVITEPTRP